MDKKPGNKPKIVAVLGPTASGKSELALHIAERFSGEIISCDSMQLYRNMDIGTAKASSKERLNVPHHMIDILSIQDTYSVSDYVRSAYACADGIIERLHLPILCGGTMLYADSFVNNVDFGEFENLPGIREELESCDSQEIYEKLKSIDPDSADKLNISDRKRMIRALEVYFSTGKTITEWKKDSMKNGRKYDFLILGVNFADREKLYERINSRVDKMMLYGLLSEAEMLYRSGLENTPTAGQAIGYKEFYGFFRGQASLEECVDTLKMNSRRYAKRQLTWFKRNDEIVWLYPDVSDNIFDEAEAAVQKFLEK